MSEYIAGSELVARVTWSVWIEKRYQQIKRRLLGDVLTLTAVDCMARAYVCRLIQLYIERVISSSGDASR